MHTRIGKHVFKLNNIVTITQFKLFKDDVDRLLLTFVNGHEIELENVTIEEFLNKTKYDHFGVEDLTEEFSKGKRGK